MRKPWLFRLGLGAVFALLLLGSTMLVQAAPPAAVPTPAAGEPLDCRQCHESFFVSLESGRHGQAATAGFLAAWDQQGKPSACLSCHAQTGLTCDACHATRPDHPNSPASVDRSADKCGQCHKATQLAWQVSAHGQNSIACVDCHDSHATGKEMKGNPSIMCANCHKDSNSNFAHQAHLSVDGMTCADCHLTPAGDMSANPHLMRDHSFNVKVTTCNACHTSKNLQGALPLPVTTPVATPVDPMASALTVQASPTPQPVSPVGYALLSICVGFGIGIVVAPWVERRLRRPGGR